MVRGEEGCAACSLVVYAVVAAGSGVRAERNGRIQQGTRAPGDVGSHGRL